MKSLILIPKPGIDAEPVDLGYKPQQIIIKLREAIIDYVYDDIDTWRPWYAELAEKNTADEILEHSEKIIRKNTEYLLEEKI
jgi:hypothetical protein